MSKPGVILKKVKALDMAKQLIRVKGNLSEMAREEGITTAGISKRINHSDVRAEILAYLEKAGAPVAKHFKRHAEQLDAKKIIPKTKFSPREEVDDWTERSKAIDRGLKMTGFLKDHDGPGLQIVGDQKIVIMYANENDSSPLQISSPLRESPRNP